MATPSAPAFAPPRVVIVGGGVSGLAAARRVLERLPEARVTVLEADARLGGKIRTERVDGFTVEAGPDSFLSSKARGVGLCEALGLGPELQGITPRPHRAFVLRGGRLHELPEGLTGLVPTKLAPLAKSRLISPLGKVRMAMDWLTPPRPGDDDEALGAFVRRRLGDETWERLVEPLMAGIYAADGDRLSLLATFPQLREAEVLHGGLAKGVLAARGAEAAGPRKPAFLTPRAGLQRMTDALADQLAAAGAELRVSSPAREIVETEGGARVALHSGETLEADAVILATPAWVSGDLLAGVDPALAADLRAIPYGSSAIATLGWRLADVPPSRLLDAHGYLIPRVERQPILAATWSSRKWANRAPEDALLVRVFIGRFGQEELLASPDEALAALAEREIRARLGIAPGAKPLLARVTRWPSGMPQYVLGHPERVARIEERAAARPWLEIAGNALHGVGVPDAIAASEAAAERAAAALATRRSSPLAREHERDAARR